VTHKQGCEFYKVFSQNETLSVSNDDYGGNEELTIDSGGFMYKYDSQFASCKIEVNFKYCPCCGVEMGCAYFGEENNNA